MQSNPRDILATLVIAGSLLLTEGGLAQHFEYKEHHLGATGLFGVTSPKDIKITKVEKGSPADGLVNVGDVITGVGGAMFNDNTRKLLADAIDEAETEKAKGILTLELSDGKKIDLPLKVLGGYSGTAPADCPKSDAIITRTADHLAASKQFGRMEVGLLGLMATGEPKYIEVVKAAVHEAKWSKPDVELTLSPASSAWDYGYTAITLCEYFLLTGDESVLPAINTYAVTIAKGRDAAGLWGHRMADPASNRGQLHGRLFGYAVMNQSSLPCFISLLLAEKCGVKDPEVRAAIEQNHTFYSGFTNKGTLPYGVHNPNAKSYNNNGMSGLTAIAMSLYGDKEGTAFFSQMSLAAHNTMETGHTGHYFNQLWTGLGANLAGPEATSAFFSETRWLRTLNRTWDGSFTYDDCGYKTPNYSYRNISDAGSHLLNYCLPRHKLYITGRDADPSIQIKGKEVSDTVALATMEIGKKSDGELLELFGHPMPKLRIEAVWALRGREHKLLGAIVKMIKEGTENQRSSAIGYFGYKCPPELARPVRDDLGAILKDPAADLDLRADVAGALPWLGEEAYPYFGDMLEIILADEPNDPLGRLDEVVGGGLNSMCADPYSAGLVKDKELFYAAIHKLLDHKRASGRIAGIQLISKVPLEDFHRVADQVRYIIEDKDINYHSYHNMGPKTGAISIYANLNIGGGIEYAFASLEDPTGKAGFKIRMLMDVLPKYGANAKYALPKDKAVNAGKFQKQWDQMVAKIETSTGTTEMISFEDAKRIGGK